VRRQTARASLIAFVVAGALYAAVAASLPFYDKGEPREALVAQAMLRGSGIILPRPDGQDMPSKPPLFHWLAVVAAEGIGDAGEFAMRLPSVLFGALGVALTALVATRWYGTAAGLTSAIVLASSFEWMRAATQSRVDMTLTFFVVATILVWRRGMREPGRRSAVRAGYLTVSAAVLTKGPVGVVLPALVLAADSLRRREPRTLLRLVDAAGVLTMLMLCLGWYGLAWRRGGAEFASHLLVQENVQRFVGWGKVAHRNPSLYYVPALAGAFLPWTFAVPMALRRAWGRLEREDGFLLVWIVTIIGFFSLAAGKRSTYLLPLFPPLAILTGAALAEWTARGPGRAARVALVGAGVAVLGIAAGVGAGLLSTTMLETFVSGSDQGRLPVAIVAIGEHRWEIAAALAVVAATLLVCASPRSTRVARHAAVALTAVVATVGLTAFGTYPLAWKLTSRRFAERLLGHMRPGDALCTCGDLDEALRFYLKGPIPPCSARLLSTTDLRTSAIRVGAVTPAGARRRYRIVPVGRGATRPCAEHGAIAARSLGAS
jgi:4-amino-4-deoxy-L-arabinose transferase-like glycosyltransferase